MNAVLLRVGFDKTGTISSSRLTAYSWSAARKRTCFQSEARSKTLVGSQSWSQAYLGREQWSHSGSGIKVLARSWSRAHWLGQG